MMLTAFYKNKAVFNDAYYAVSIDGNTTNMIEGTVYRGLGVITGNNSSRLLMDYKTENPDAYWEIMNLLFKKDYGAGLTHVKIEFGSDVNSSSGTEPSIMRSADEEADVTRGAGFMFAADALSINPDITVDLLRWGEPQKSPQTARTLPHISTAKNSHNTATKAPTQIQAES